MPLTQMAAVVRLLILRPSQGVGWPCLANRLATSVTDGGRRSV
jgi:hypothetical protein